MPSGAVALGVAAAGVLGIDRVIAVTFCRRPLFAISSAALVIASASPGRADTDCCGEDCGCGNGEGGGSAACAAEALHARDGVTVGDGCAPFAASLDICATDGELGGWWE